MKHSHQHSHRRGHPHALGHFVTVEHDHQHNHYNQTEAVRGDKKAHGPHKHTPEEEADLRRKQLR